MKKFALILVALLALVFVSCQPSSGGSDDNDSSQFVNNTPFDLPCLDATSSELINLDSGSRSVLTRSARAVASSGTAVVSPNVDDDSNYFEPVLSIKWVPAKIAIDNANINLVYHYTQLVAGIPVRFTVEAVKDSIVTDENGNITQYTVTYSGVYTGVSGAYINVTYNYVGGKEKTFDIVYRVVLKRENDNTYHPFAGEMVDAIINDDDYSWSGTYSAYRYNYSGKLPVGSPLKELGQYTLWQYNVSVDADAKATLTKTGYVMDVSLRPAGTELDYDEASIDTTIYDPSASDVYSQGFWTSFKKLNAFLNVYDESAYQTNLLF